MRVSVGTPRGLSGSAGVPALPRFPATCRGPQGAPGFAHSGLSCLPRAREPGLLPYSKVPPGCCSRGGGQWPVLWPPVLWLASLVCHLPRNAVACWPAGLPLGSPAFHLGPPLCRWRPLREGPRGGFLGAPTKLTPLAKASGSFPERCGWQSCPKLSSALCAPHPGKVGPGAPCTQGDIGRQVWVFMKSSALPRTTRPRLHRGAQARRGPPAPSWPAEGPGQVTTGTLRGEEAGLGECQPQVLQQRGACGPRAAGPTLGAGRGERSPRLPRPALTPGRPRAYLCTSSQGGTQLPAGQPRAGGGHGGWLPEAPPASGPSRRPSRTCPCATQPHPR